MRTMPRIRGAVGWRTTISGHSVTNRDEAGRGALADLIRTSVKSSFAHVPTSLPHTFPSSSTLHLLLFLLLTPLTLSILSQLLSPWASSCFLQLFFSFPAYCEDCFYAARNSTVSVSHSCQSSYGVHGSCLLSSTFFFLISLTPAFSPLGFAPPTPSHRPSFP